MKVYITKYATTLGIIECDAKIYDDLSIRVKSDYYRPGEWSTNFDYAKMDAIKRVSNKIASLKQQIEKLHKIRF